MFKLFNLKQNLKYSIINQNKLLYFNKNYNFSCNIIYLTEISYTGKTYKWNIKKKLFKLIFNRAHKTNLFINKNVFLKKLAKTKLRLFFLTKKTFNIFNILMYKTRKYNIFTQRGLKIKKKIILKKKGKVSTYR